MLVLSRKIGERIVVPHCGLTVAVLAVRARAARLGISAPAEVPVYREEVWQRVGQFRDGLTAEGSIMQGNDGTTGDRDAAVEGFVAALTSAAYAVALRHCARDKWLDLELDLWNALSDTVKQWVVDARGSTTNQIGRSTASEPSHVNPAWREQCHGQTTHRAN